MVANKSKFGQMGGRQTLSSSLISLLVLEHRTEGTYRNLPRGILCKNTSGMLKITTRISTTLRGRSSREAEDFDIRDAEDKQR
jgi:hypothetical protein